MDQYINHFESYKNAIVYDFNIGDGGLADCIKFFMWNLQKAILGKFKLYYKINNIPIEKYLKLLHNKMYFNNTINNSNIKFIKPNQFYNDYSDDDIIIPISDVFLFSNEIINNANNFINEYSIAPKYISLHLRLGDKFLETDKRYVQCKEDKRTFYIDRIDDFIKNNIHSNIIFFCDNNQFKKQFLNKNKNVISFNSNICHTGLKNTTNVLDTITELYIMSKSEKIISASKSGFSIIASKFNNIPIEYLY